MKTALITGANRGIGFETARQLAVRGFHVVMGARSAQHGQKAVRELEEVGNVSLLVVDVSDSKSIALAASKFASIGQLDVLINNAGIYPDEGGSILQHFPRADCDHISNEHLRASRNDAGFSAISERIIDGTSNKCVEWLRSA